MDRKVPVTVFTGFLGAGKTTLLNYVLAGSHGKKIAVIENEFGEVGVDDSLVKRKLMTEEQVFEMNNGCICCTVRGDLIRILHKLLRTPEGMRLDAIFVETTGMADPAPVAQTFLTDKFLKEATELDAIVTVVDAKHIEAELLRPRSEGAENEAEEQIAFADVVLLNKVDLVSETEKAKALSLIGAINADAEIIQTEQCRVDLDKIIGIRGFDVERILEKEPDFLNDEASHEHVHDTEVSSVGVRLDASFSLDINKFLAFVQKLIAAKGSDLLRYKGVLQVKGMSNKYVFQGVRMIFDGYFAEEEWDADDTRQSIFVFIGKGLDRDALIAGIKTCNAQPLRFEAGTKVTCSTQHGWLPGKIKKCWDDGNAYRVQLDVGFQVWAPSDDDRFVRSG